MKKLKDWDLGNLSIILFICVFMSCISIVGYCFFDSNIFKGLMKPSIFMMFVSGALFYIVDKAQQKAQQKALLDSIVRTEKSYYKGRVISKDKTVETSGDRDYISTRTSYTTTVRLEGSERIIYFYDAQTFNECYEGELVSIEIQKHYDKDNNVVLTDYYHRGSANAV